MAAKRELSLFPPQTLGYPLLRAPGHLWLIRSKPSQLAFHILKTAMFCPSGKKDGKPFPGLQRKLI